MPWKAAASCQRSRSISALRIPKEYLALTEFVSYAKPRLAQRLFPEPATPAHRKALHLTEGTRLFRFSSWLTIFCWFRDTTLYGTIEMGDPGQRCCRGEDRDDENR